MTEPEPEQTPLRAAVFDAVTEAIAGLQRHIDEQILELQADIDLALDKLDSIEIDLKDTRVQVAKISRELIKDRRRDETTAKRIAEHDRRITSIEKGI